jgi:hypothetical protein
VALKTALAIVQLHRDDNPPTVWFPGNACAPEIAISYTFVAEAIVQKGINSPDVPGEVYQA